MKPRLAMLIATLAALTTLVACAGSPAARPLSSQPPADAAMSAKSARPAATAQPGAAPAAAAVPSQNATAGPGAGESQPNAPASASASWDRMIVRNATVSLVVNDVDTAVNAVTTVAVQHGGMVLQSSRSVRNDLTNATLNLMIPSGAFDQAMRDLRSLDQLVRVDSENTTGQDVTEEFTDVQSQLRNLQATEASLMRLFDKAQRVEDILAIQRELTTVRGQIERLQGRANFLSRRSEMSSIAVTLIPAAAAKAQSGSAAWSPLRTAVQAWERSLIIVRTAADAAITLVVFFWWLLPLALIGWFVLQVLRGRRPARPATDANH